LFCDPVLGIVEIDACSLDRQPLSAPGLLGKKLSEMNAFEILEMCLQRGPSRTQP
jgi:hypothetical protein